MPHHDYDRAPFMVESCLTMIVKSFAYDWVMPRHAYDRAPFMIESCLTMIMIELLSWLSHTSPWVWQNFTY